MSTRRRDASRSPAEYYARMPAPPAAALAWAAAGSFFSWTSTLPENAGRPPLNIFSIRLGDPTKPALLLVHGYPTSSFDFAALARLLSRDFHVCALDTPGYGFSDKPRGGYRYSIFDDARLVDHFLREVARIEDVALLTHDKGDSVGLALLQIYQSAPVQPYRINHHFITNGNVYLPLARLTVAQQLLLHPLAGPVLSSLLDGARLARGLGRSTFTRRPGPDALAALASVFDYQDGTGVEHDLIQYLNERKAHEVTWLETLARSEIPTTLIWGERDTIAPTAVPDFVWEKCLRGLGAPAVSWRIPEANHYLQNDQPEVLASLVRTMLTASPDLSERPGARLAAIGGRRAVAGRPGG